MKNVKIFLQSLRVVQAKIQEIEKQPTKSAKEENELAQLHVKQQQILAAGRPVNTQNVTEVSVKYIERELHESMMHVFYPLYHLCF